jgi:hypothetical protein
MEPFGLGAVMRRDCDPDGQRRGLRNDEQPDQAARPPGTSPRFAPGRDDIGIRVARAVGHLIIAGGYSGNVNQQQVPGTRRARRKLS